MPITPQELTKIMKKVTADLKLDGMSDTEISKELITGYKEQYGCLMSTTIKMNNAHISKALCLLVHHKDVKTFVDIAEQAYELCIKGVKPTCSSAIEASVSTGYLTDNKVLKMSDDQLKDLGIDETCVPTLPQDTELILTTKRCTYPSVVHRSLTELLADSLVNLVMLGAYSNLSAIAKHALGIAYVLSLNTEAAPSLRAKYFFLITSVYELNQICDYDNILSPDERVRVVKS